MQRGCLSGTDLLADRVYIDHRVATLHSRLLPCEIPSVLSAESEKRDQSRRGRGENLVRMEVPTRS
eukprot:1491596-Rhodomonas_salina.1